MNETVRTQEVTSLGKAQHVSGSASPHAVKAMMGVLFWLIVAYFFIDYVRPQDQLSVIRLLKPGLILTIILGTAWLVKGDKGVLKDPVIILYCLFILLAASTVVFARNTFFVYQITRSLFIDFAVTLACVAFLNTRERITRFFKIWVAMHVWLALMSMAHAGRGSGSFLSDENDWALALNMAIPYAFFYSRSPNCSRRMRIFYLGAFAILILAVAATVSRGGFVGLVAVLAALVFFSRHRIRNFVLLLIMAAMLVPLMPKEYFQQIGTISNASDPTREDRLYSWRLGWTMFLDNPIVGVGAGNYPWTVSHYELRSAEYDPDKMRAHGGRAAHSLYFTLLPELGTTGVLIYSAIIILIFRRLARLGRLGKSRKPPGEKLTDLELLSRAMIVSLFGYFVSGAFISVLYYPHVWYLIAFALALERVAAHPDNAAGAHVLGRTPDRTPVREPGPLA